MFTTSPPLRINRHPTMIGGTVRSEPHLTVSWLKASQSRAGDTTRGGANSAISYDVALFMDA